MCDWGETEHYHKTILKRDPATLLPFRASVHQWSLFGIKLCCNCSCTQDWDILEYNELACLHCRARDQASKLLQAKTCHLKSKTKCMKKDAKYKEASKKSTKSPTESKKEKDATPLGKKLAEKIKGIVNGQEKEAEEVKEEMEEEYVLEEKRCAIPWDDIQVLLTFSLSLSLSLCATVDTHLQ
jgi:hypothetical protein